MVHFPPKVVSILCSLQSLAILLGYAVTRSFHKIYAELETGWAGDYIPPLAWFTKWMLAYGPWLLLVPFTWGMVATLMSNLDGGLPEASEKQTRIGYALTVGTATFSVISVLQILGAVFAPPQIHVISVG